MQPSTALSFSNNGLLAVVFDIGHVLIDWNPHYLYSRLFRGDDQAMLRFLEEVGFYEWNTLQDAGRPFSEAVAELVARFPEYAEMIRAYDDRWEESVGEPLWGTVAIARALRQAGYPLYALSNWSAEKFPLIRRQHAFFDWFEDILISGEVRLVKPDPGIYQAFLARTGRQPEQCLFIDNSPANLSIADQLGFHTILFRSPEQLASELYRKGLLSENDAIFT